MPDPFGILATIAILVSIPNVLINIYLDKDKDNEDCATALKKYVVGTHKQVAAASAIVNSNTTPRATASHHVMQNALLQYSRSDDSKSDTSISGCPNYTPNDGIAIMVDNTSGGDHSKLNRQQSEFAKLHRNNGTIPSYKDAQEEMKKQLMTIKNPTPMTKRAAECIVEKVDDMMRKLCPDVVENKQPLNVPKN